MATRKWLSGPAGVVAIFALMGKLTEPKPAEPIVYPQRVKVTSKMTGPI